MRPKVAWSEFLREITKKFLNFYGLHRPLSVLTLLGVDTVALLVGLVLAAYLVGGSLRVEEVLHFAPVLLAVWLAICSAHGLYERAPSRRNRGALLGGFSEQLAFCRSGRSFTRRADSRSERFSSEPLSPWPWTVRCDSYTSGV